jgi:hypothetical protein
MLPQQSILAPVRFRARSPASVVSGAALALWEHGVPVRQQLALELDLILHERECVGE